MLKIDKMTAKMKTLGPNKTSSLFFQRYYIDKFK